MKFCYYHSYNCHCHLPCYPDKDKDQTILRQVASPCFRTPAFEWWPQICFPLPHTRHSSSQTPRTKHEDYLQLGIDIVRVHRSLDKQRWYGARCGLEPGERRWHLLCLPLCELPSYATWPDQRHLVKLQAKTCWLHLLGVMWGHEHKYSKLHFVITGIITTWFWPVMALDLGEGSSTIIVGGKYSEKSCFQSQIVINDGWTLVEPRKTLVNIGKRWLNWCF